MSNSGYDPANLPMKPFKLIQKIVLIGIALGIGCGAGLVFCWSILMALSESLKMYIRVIGVPVLVSVPDRG